MYKSHADSGPGNTVAVASRYAELIIKDETILGVCGDLQAPHYRGLAGHPGWVSLEVVNRLVRAQVSCFFFGF